MESKDDDVPNSIVVAISFCVADSLLDVMKIETGDMERAEREGIDEEGMGKFIQTLVPWVRALKDFDSYVESEEIEIVRRRLVTLIHSLFVEKLRMGESCPSSTPNPFTLLKVANRITLRNFIKTSQTT